MVNNEERLLSLEKTIEFQKILRAIINFESKNSSVNTEFRKKLVSSDASDLSVKVDHIEEYVYSVRCTYNGETHEWIHIDSIFEEREALLKKGVTKHPVFDIVCLSDLYDE